MREWLPQKNGKTKICGRSLEKGEENEGICEKGLLNYYGVTLEGADDNFKAFVEDYRAGVEDTARAHVDYDDADEAAYGRLPKFEEFALTAADKEMGRIYDDVFAQNATAHFGQIMVNSDTFLKFDDIGSFERGCKRCQYFILVNGHPDQWMNN